MDKEKLIKQIMRECEQDGEPITREEAEEMAEMEIKANGIKHYEQSDKPRKTAVRERKVDGAKREIIQTIFTNIDRVVYTDDKDVDHYVEGRKIKNPEREITFTLNGEEYSVTLTKHRKPKGEK